MNPRRPSHGIRAPRPFLRRIVPVAAMSLGVMFLAAAAPGESAGSGPATATGTRVTKRVPFVRESIDEIRALAPLRSRAVLGDRSIPFRRIQRRAAATEETGSRSADPALAPSLLASSPASSAPALDSSFPGLGNPPHGQDVIPPDTMGAAGPGHLVSILNSDFGVFDKATGAVLQKISLQSFWGSLGTEPGGPADFPFDPKILYDQHSGRFIAITLGGRSAPDSWILIAVSPPSGPTGEWDKWAIDADVDNDVVQTDAAADYPGLGVDQFNIYVTTNMFDANESFEYGKAWIVPKAQLLTNPGPTLTFFESHGPFFSGLSRQPAHTFGAASETYLVSEGLLQTNNQLALTRIDNVSGAPVVHLPVSVSIAPYSSPFPFPGAPQRGLGIDNAIDTSDTRVLNVVYRNGSVWATHHVVGPSGKVEVAWYRINPVSRTVESQGRITDPNRWYYYPSIAVNKDDVAAIGFSGSSPAEYVGGYYTILRSPGGAAENVALLKAGEAPYYKSFSGGDNRWGDFSATVVDPTDDTSFWTLQEYAKLPVAGRSQWGTWWGRFAPGNPPAPPPPSGSGGGGGGGCLSVTRAPDRRFDASPAVSVLFLFLPAAVYGLRRVVRSRRTR